MTPRGQHHELLTKMRKISPAMWNPGQEGGRPESAAVRQEHGEKAGAQPSSVGEPFCHSWLRYGLSSRTAMEDQCIRSHQSPAKLHATTPPSLHCHPAHLVPSTNHLSPLALPGDRADDTSGPSFLRSPTLVPDYLLR